MNVTRFFFSHPRCSGSRLALIHSRSLSHFSILLLLTFNHSLIHTPGFFSFLQSPPPPSCVSLYPLLSLFHSTLSFAGKKKERRRNARRSTGENGDPISVPRLEKKKKEIERDRKRERVGDISRGASKCKMRRRRHEEILCAEGVESDK